MKIKILPLFALLALFISPFAAGAQPVLTQQSNGFRPGVSYLFAGTNSITALPAIGKNITWDYSYMVPDTINIIYDSAGNVTGYLPDTFSINFIVPPTNNPNLIARFPQANLFAMQYEDYGTNNGLATFSYEAFTINSSSQKDLGFIDQDSNLNVLDTDYFSGNTYPPFPITYGNIQTNNYAEDEYGLYANGVNQDVHDTAYNFDSTWADAYGTLKLPGKTYTNVLAIKIKDHNLLFNTWYTDYAYDFWAPGYGLPVLTISFDSTGTIVGTRYLMANSTLPLNLLSFTGTLQHNNALLQWQTTQEINTQSFAIQRSADGINFTPLGSVPATDAPGTNNYSYTDTKPLQADNYYRLKMYDKDGAFTYSRTVLLNNGGGAFALQVQPNPAASSATLAFNSLIAGKYSVTMAGMDGKTIKRINGVAVTGANTLQLDISGLAKGVYTVTFTSADGTHSLKFVRE